ncbi:MAG: hypothetical protein ACKO8C_03135 [Candidatus Nanopelagicaceae bacterium]
MAIENQENQVPPSLSYWQDVRKRFFGNKISIVGLVILSALILIGIFGPIVSNWKYDELGSDILAAPGTNGHWLGTDDLGIGYEMQDLAITFFYLRDMPGKEEVVLEGYKSVCEPPKVKSHQLEALLLSRQLLLLNDLLDVTTAEEIASTPEYIEITRLRIKNFLDTGRFELIRRLR